MAWRLRYTVGFLTLSVGLVHCSSTKSLLRQRFSREHSCQEDKVFAREALANTYVVEGCGQRAEYICNTFAGRNTLGCQERGMTPNASPDAPKRTYYNLEEPPR